MFNFAHTVQKITAIIAAMRPGQRAANGQIHWFLNGRIKKYTKTQAVEGIKKKRTLHYVGQIQGYNIEDEEYVVPPYTKVHDSYCTSTFKKMRDPECYGEEDIEKPDILPEPRNRMQFEIFPDVSNLCIMWTIIIVSCHANFRTFEFVIALLNFGMVRTLCVLRSASEV